MQSLGKDSEEDYADITQPDTSDFPSQEDASETGMAAMGKQAGSSEVWHLVDSLSSDATSSHVARTPKYMTAVQTVEPLTLPKDVEDALQRGIDAHVAAGPLPQPKNTTSRKVTPLTEKSSQATDTEEETLETLQDLQVHFNLAALKCQMVFRQWYCHSVSPLLCRIPLGSRRWTARWQRKRP